MKDKSDTQARRVQEELRLNYGPNKKFVTVCAGTGCRAYGSFKVKEALEAEIKKQNMNVEVLATGCFVSAKKAPWLSSIPINIFISRLKSKTCRKLFPKP